MTAPRPLAAAIVASVFLGIGSGFLWAEDQLLGQPIHVPLTSRAVNANGNGMLPPKFASQIMAATRYLQPLSAKPEGQLKSEPKLHTPYYFKLASGSREILIVVDVEQGGEKATLYADLDGKGELGGKSFHGVDQNKRSSGVSSYAFFKFGPIPIPKVAGVAGVAGGPVEVTASMGVFKRGSGSNYRPYLRVIPQSLMEGSLRIGAVQYPVSFVDGALTGKFETQKPDAGSRSEMMRMERAGASIMAVDLDRNGSIDQRWEVSPLVEMVRIDGKYYHVNVTPNGSEATFQEVKPEMGVLDTKCPAAKLFVISDRCAALLTPNQDGKWELPVGTYSTVAHALCQQQGSVKWTLAGAQTSSAMERMDIQAATPHALDMGAPVTFAYSVNSRSNQGTVSIGLEIKGKSGESYSPGVEKNGVQGAAPQFTISDEQGKRLTEGKFEYG